MTAIFRKLLLCNRSKRSEGYRFVVAGFVPDSILLTWRNQEDDSPDVARLSDHDFHPCCAMLQSAAIPYYLLATSTCYRQSSLSLASAVSPCGRLCRQNGLYHFPLVEGESGARGGFTAFARPLVSEPFPALICLLLDSSQGRLHQGLGC